MKIVSYRELKKYYTKECGKLIKKELKEKGNIPFGRLSEIYKEGIETVNNINCDKLENFEQITLEF